jgi:hypothetical protein
VAIDEAGGLSLLKKPPVARTSSAGHPFPRDADADGPVKPDHDVKD